MLDAAGVHWAHSGAASNRKPSGTDPTELAAELAAAQAYARARGVGVVLRL